jgi:hypothetical protein
MVAGVGNMEREQIAKLISENYFDATNTSRHYDTLRVAFSSLSISVIALLAGFSTAQIKGGSLETVRVLAVIGSLLALLSVIVVLKLNGLIVRQRHRARASIRLLEEHCGGPSISLVDHEVRERSRTSLMDSVPLSLLWAGLFAILFLFSALAAIFPARMVIP